MAETVKTVPDGVDLPINSLAQAFAGNPITTITVVYKGNTYVQTFTYVAGAITNISAWIKQ